MSKYDIIERKRKYEIMMGGSFAILIIVAIVFTFGSDVMPFWVDLIVFLMFGLFTIFQFYLNKLVKQLKLDYKNLSVTSIFKSKYPDFKYSPEKGFDKEYIYNTGIIKKSSTFSSEDYLEGDFDGMHFESADIHCQDRRSNGKNTYYVTVFQGRFYRVHVDKPFPLGVYILPVRYNSFMFNANYKKFDVEGIEFNKKFNVYSNDHKEALLRVRPVVIDRILSFSKTVKKVMIGFEGTMIYIAVDNRKDNFDLKLFKPISFDSGKEIDEELKLTKDLIELLT